MIEWSTEQIWRREEFFRVPESKISVTRIRTSVPAVLGLKPGTRASWGKSKLREVSVEELSGHNFYSNSFLSNECNK